jgi:hypothetical protein
VYFLTSSERAKGQRRFEAELTVFKALTWPNSLPPLPLSFRSAFSGAQEWDTHAAL